MWIGSKYLNLTVCQPTRGTRSWMTPPVRNPRKLAPQKLTRIDYLNSSRLFSASESRYSWNKCWYKIRVLLRLGENCIWYEINTTFEGFILSLPTLKVIFHKVTLFRTLGKLIQLICVSTSLILIINLTQF